ncbi:homeobox-domain-containing protein [Phlebopus sp. FC_14]|nr:homeobox-domain-containing protein [Phlebopus sp. FC_14]
MQSSLSRTSSAASISSDDTARRTRKRFSNIQLMMLEQLFHQTSHPTREEREAVAQAAGMEMKSVTIWFQNKRQTERKVALHQATNHANTDHHRLQAHFPEHLSSHDSTSSTSPTTATFALGTLPHTHTARPAHAHARTISTSSIHTPRRKITPPRARPSLDRVAARSESRLPPPRTPTKPHNPNASPWDNMPSSPLAPPASPPTRDFVDFVGSGRTLEWACAAARLAEKEKEGRVGAGGVRRSLAGAADTDAGEETEEDDVEAVTPNGSQGSVGDVAWRDGRRLVPASQKQPLNELSDRRPGSAKDAVQDDDMMRAALVLCGLGRRSG